MNEERQRKIVHETKIAELEIMKNEMLSVAVQLLLQQQQQLFGVQ